MAVVKKLGVFYTVLITASVLIGLAAIAALYYAGSAAVPGWRSFFQPGPLSGKHAFLNDQCETCHTPTKGVAAATCITCHSSAAADLAKQPTAFHANVQDCRGCHVEHQGGSRPTRMDHSALLRIGWHTTGAVQGHPTLSRQMIDDLASYLGILVSAPAEKEALNCTSCHSNQDPHQKLLGSGCADCHATSTWRIASFLHPSPTSKECAQCHQAPPSHYMEHFSMVSQRIAGQEHAGVLQCYQCHQTNAWNDIKGAGWYKHH
ncbi:class III cytochrome C family protein [Microvirga sp. GCM10011540]